MLDSRMLDSRTVYLNSSKCILYSIQCCMFELRTVETRTIVCLESVVLESHTHSIPANTEGESLFAKINFDHRHFQKWKNTQQLFSLFVVFYFLFLIHNDMLVILYSIQCILLLYVELPKVTYRAYIIGSAIWKIHNWYIVFPKPSYIRCVLTQLRMHISLLPAPFNTQLLF